jgi:diamine N-acetyltransferase
MLIGKKVYLRTLEPQDADQLLYWENDPENWKVSNTIVPFSRELIQQYVNSAQDIYAVKQIRFMICSTDTKKSIGAIDLFDFDPRHQRMGIGILIDKNERQNGYASEALELVEVYALDQIGIRNLYFNILEDNQDSIRLFEQAGFVKIGHKKNWFNHSGKWLDELMFQKELVAH